MLIPAQIVGFVQEQEGWNLHKSAAMCIVVFWLMFFPDTFYCQFSLQVFLTEIIHDSWKTDENVFFYNINDQEWPRIIRKYFLRRS